ncbi:MAG: AAA family ATPase, partial [Clostridia bacterium]|nr:AAA family ATPase [Clostridia bacterium]
MKTKKPKKTLLITLLAIAVAVGALLLAAVFTSFDRVGQENGTPLLFTENIFVIMILAILLPVTIVFLMTHVMKRHRSFRNYWIDKCSESKEISDKDISVDIDLQSVGVSGTATSSGGDGFYADGEEFEESGSRFYMLDKTDREMAKREEPKYDDDTDLEQICEQFRNFAASRMGLYYDISDIRRFIAGMAVTHILIMQGMSGTGKTSLAYAFGEFMNNPSVIVPIQPMWKEKSDLVGYYNEFTKRFNETVLLQKMYEANYTDDIYITVLDEMNIARVEYYFAEFLSLLELPNPESRRIEVVSDEW